MKIVPDDVKAASLHPSSCRNLCLVNEENYRETKSNFLRFGRPVKFLKVVNTSVYQFVGPNVTFTLVTLVGTELDIRVSDNELELERVPDPA